MKVSKTESPVTQVADVAVNKASINFALPGDLDENGKQRKKAPIKTIKRKLKTISCTADIFFNFFKINLHLANKLLFGRNQCAHQLSKSVAQNKLNFKSLQ